MSGGFGAHARIWGSPQDFVESGPVLGRKVANVSFLSAFLKADPYDAYHFFASGPGARAEMEAWLHDAAPSLMRRGAARVLDRTRLQASLAETRYHCMHLPDALTLYTPLMQARNAFAANLFPVTGLTHSLSYAHFMGRYLDHLWPGVTRRDGIIATSTCAGAVLERAYAALRREYGLDAAAFPAPGLSHIPLGVAAESMPGPGERHDAEGGDAARAMRRRLGIGGEPVFLCFARFCHQSKMDLMPLFSAFRRAEGLGLPPGGYALIMAGWAEEDDALPESLLAMAQGLGIKARLVVRPTAPERRALYAAADVFVSPSDNIQETFGLTVAEAALAGLPAVASDFDGYRDIVEDGVTGLLVPTMGFGLSGETDVQARLWFDNQYHLKMAQETALSVPALAGALAALGTDGALRRAMGEAARQRGLALFSWDRVLERWVALWDTLAATPLSQEEKDRARKARHPRLMPFAELFAGHFTNTLGGGASPDMTLARTPLGDALYRGELPLVRYAGMELMLDPEAVRLMLLAARRPVPVRELLNRLERHFVRAAPAWAAAERAAFTVLWSLKQDYLERTDAPGSPSEQ